jgi:magnesium-transporting ATPase (P-type)
VTVSVIETLNQANIRTIMATGDNVLTAISVGRECNIIEADAEVFLGDMVRGADGGEKVAWKSTKGPQHRLNAGTLVPEEIAEIKANHLLNHHQYPDMKASGLEHSREEDERSVTDIVVLYDFPW